MSQDSVVFFESIQCCLCQPLPVITLSGRQARRSGSGASVRSGLPFGSWASGLLVRLTVRFLGVRLTGPAYRSVRLACPVRLVHPAYPSCSVHPAYRSGLPFGAPGLSGSLGASGLSGLFGASGLPGLPGLSPSGG